jgi:hypothetical protein
MVNDALQMVHTAVSQYPYMLEAGYLSLITGASLFGAALERIA